ncbi:MAG: FUN14 domain-containing protein, partial [Tepidisphaeraceae bacterium]
WDQWSPPIFRFGFSFFAGFCIAYALRTVLKVGLFVAGAVLIAVLALQYAGLMNVDWNSVAGNYDSVAAWLRGQCGSFKDFLTGHLPSAGSAMAGLVLGFLR